MNEILEYSNTGKEELIRQAEHSDNKLALALVHEFESGDDSEESLLSTLTDDVAVFMTTKIEEKLSDYINSYYLDPKSDYFDFLYDLELDDSDIATTYPDVDLAVVMSRLNDNLDYYTEVDIVGSYACSRGCTVASAMIGEIEESLDLIDNEFIGVFTDCGIHSEVRDHVLENVSVVSVHKDSDCLYINLSDHSANLVLRADRLDELLEPGE